MRKLKRERLSRDIGSFASYAFFIGVNFFEYAALLKSPIY